MTDDQITDEEVKSMQQELARLTRMVYYDQLTDILNRRGFLEEAERAFHVVSYHTTTMERRLGFPIPFSVLFFDIDNFKSINDTYGHPAGDEALRMLTQVVKRNLRLGDLFGRFGGEEFTVALPGASLELAELAAEKLCRAIEATHMMWEGTHIVLTASFGVAEYHHEETFDDIIAKADRAMYQAKQAGKNRVVLWKEE